MGKVISLINLKGGVGKTTTTVALAEFLTLEKRKKVLVIDLDPQTNATVMLINQDAWKRANDNKRTIHQMFLDKLNDTDYFDIYKSIIKGVSSIGGGIPDLHLLPSSIDLLDVQDRIPMINQMNSFAQSPITVLANYLTQQIIDEYDYILIDCPPNLGVITLNGIYLSDYYLIPVVADILSTYGIPQIKDRINKVSVNIKSINRSYNIKPLGIVITKYRMQSRMHRETRDDLILRSKLAETDKRSVPQVFKVYVKETTRISEATDIDVQINTLKQKYGYSQEVYDAYENITNEFIRRVK
ncbi:ParA family protein [Clostridium algidicarnis]|uniref:Chromosome partitioning protein n=2 Tax=Clostridium algidicarnis TaxID=37659 RepID=A0A2S6FV59_9CLOT|nr:AAA family ATPase [Clostridium algidicarnis]MBU3197647.1 AAA family ATPase [Clostridium algidicarnis]MBU3221090.1 AAA family ATPase [Clostridium algidicarnis]PPK45558.1 chromosome partitioning protein [Clostridium algidicarnis DSM 15099]